MTNYERIKAMSVEEMTRFINCCFCTSSNDFISCKTCFIEKLCEEMNQDCMQIECDEKIIKQWLKSEAENDR